MGSKYGGGIYWLLDVRFDFLLPSFIQRFEIEIQDIIFVNSYHGNGRSGFRKIYIPCEELQTVKLMEPDDINRFFAKSLQFKDKTLVVSLSGAGLPQHKNLLSMVSTGILADQCNDKWWQYHFFKKCNILTPVTYQFENIQIVKKHLESLLERYHRVLIKKACLSGGYMMKVLSSIQDLEHYQREFCTDHLNQVFLVSAYLSHYQSFASMGVVQRDGGVFFINVITEQVLYQEVAYEGLIFPAFLEDCYFEQMQTITIQIGQELSRIGYFGYFNVDFILSGNELYVVELNARFGFGMILAACLYGQKIWDVIQGTSKEQPEFPQKRLVIGKLKGKTGTTYTNLKSFTNILEWFKHGDGFFQTFFCGTKEAELFEYGSFIGIFGEFFPMEDSRETVLLRFMDRCLEYFK